MDLNILCVSTIVCMYVARDTCCLLGSFDVVCMLGVNQVWCCMRDLALLICDPLVYFTYLRCVRPLGPLLLFVTDFCYACFL